MEGITRVCGAELPQPIFCARPGSEALGRARSCAPTRPVLASPWPHAIAFTGRYLVLKAALA